MGFLLFIPILILMYVILVRPQQQRVRRQRELVMSIDVGDDVVTAGGIIGRIVELSDDRAWIEVADDVVVEILRIAISRKVDEGSRDLASPEAEDEEYDEGQSEEGAEVEDAPHDTTSEHLEPGEPVDPVEHVEHVEKDATDHSDGGSH
jgi:preprotein translocase subunit YajC